MSFFGRGSGDDMMHNRKRKGGKRGNILKQIQ